MEEEDDKDDTKRKSRNLSEKKRRDQFNLLVNELSSMVSCNGRKMDKSTVLKSTIAFLKNYNEVSVRSKVHEIQENWKPSFLPNEEFTHLILEALDGFIIVFSSSGKVHYVSESITSLLGHLPNDLLHMTIYDMVYEEEQQNIYNILLNPPKTVIDPLQSGITPENQASFLCHVKRGSMETPPKISYEFVQFTGYFRDNADMENMIPSNKYSGCSADDDTRILFVGIGRLMTPQLIREMSIVDTKSEFTSRHSLEWKFLFLDHRAPPIIGYLPFEVLGTSGYDYYHFDDLERVVACHETLMQKGEGTSCFYRFLTKGQQWIWLQTRFYITYHQWNSKPEFVVCTHRVVSYADVMKHMRKSNGNMLKDVHDSDSALEDKKAPEASLMVMSPWSSKGSRASKSFTLTQESPKAKLKRSHSYHHDSDSTSMSADSPLSHHSLLTQHSSVSQRSKSKQKIQIPKQPSSQQHQQQPFPSHFSQFNIPHPQASSHHLQVLQPSPSHSIIFQPPTPSQIIPSHQRPASETAFEQSTFINAIPVQPIYSATATVISPAQAAPDYTHSNVVMTSAQNHIQSHLQRKHEELQKLIVQQQDELRRVSEQLFMARYGIIPSIVNVSMPFPVPMDQTDTGDSSHGINTSSHISHPSYHEQHSLMHHSQISSQSQTHPQIHVHPPNQNQLVTHQQHVPARYEMMTPKHNQSEQTDADRENEDIMQYMQHQAVHQQQIVNNEGFELIPFQMLNTQAQILFSSGNPSDDSNNTSSNK